MQPTQTPTNIMTASSEYAMRPADERYETLGALITAAQQDRARSHEAVYNLRDLRAVAVNTHNTPTFDPTPGDATLRLAGPKGEAQFTHYSFGQLCRTLKAPASYLRTLPPAIAADALNYGLQDAAPIGTTANLLIRDDETQPFPTVRACTSETYGRVWDAQLYGEINRWFGDGIRSNGGAWQSPPVWPGNPPGGQYRGDRDSFIIRVDGGSIVDDPRGWQAKGQSGGALHRGIMVRNSEVGECSITIECILFDVICGNHILWGAIVDRTYRRRHVGQKITRDTMQELLTISRKYNTRSASDDAQIIKALVEHEIAHTREAVIDELKKMGATKDQASEAYATAEAKEPGLNPRSFWGIQAGLTRNSQASGYQDERLVLDSLAAQVLKVGAKQYATV